MPENLSMNYKIKTIPNFDKALKRLVKKYALLKREYIALPDSLEEEPKQGVNLGNTRCYYFQKQRKKRWGEGDYSYSNQG